jgi:hypothetical protein
VSQFLIRIKQLHISAGIGLNLTANGHREFKGNTSEVCYACHVLKVFKTFLCLEQIVLKQTISTSDLRMFVLLMYKCHVWWALRVRSRGIVVLSAACCTELVNDFLQFVIRCHSILHYAVMTNMPQGKSDKVCFYS